MFGKQVFNRLDRPKPVEHRTKGQRGEDDPHEHAGDRKGLAHRSLEHRPRHPSLEHSSQKGRNRTNGRAFDKRGPAVHKGHHHHGKDHDRQQARAQQAQLFGPTHIAFLGGKGGAQIGVQAAADGDIDDEHRGHHQPRDRASQPQLPHRLPRDHGIEHQHDRRRHKDTEAGPRLNDPCHHQLVIVAFQKLGQRNRGPNRHARHRQAVHGRDQHHQPDRPDGQPPAQTAHPHVKHFI